MKNLKLKIFSLIFAIILWVFATTGKKAEIGLIVPVEIKNIPKDFVVVDLKPPSVDVRIYGPKSLLRAVLDKDLKIALDISKIKRPGIIRYRVTRSDLDLPRGVVLRGIHPRVIEVELDRFIKKKVEVVPRIRGKPDKYYKISKVSVEPNQVILEGPEKIVSRVDKIFTEPVDVKGKKGEVIFKSKVIYPKTYHTSVNPQSVEIRVEIQPKEGEKSFKVHIASPSKHIKIHPSVLTVRVRGPLELLDKLKARDIKVELNIEKGKKKGFIKPKVVLEDERLLVTSVKPEKIKFWKR